MTNDKKTTVAATTAAGGYAAGIMLLPPPWNFVAIGIGFLAHIIQGFYTNKPDAKVVNVPLQKEFGAVPH